MGECRALTLEEIRSHVAARHGPTHSLYDLMLDYPLREAKALRPSLCIATCRALGGSLEAVLPSAAALELYHNAFLIHDDVEDRSESRRGAETLHRSYGMPIAVNVGDAMLALALGPLLENTRHLGLGKALRILELVAEMSRVSAEGQAMELEWIRHEDWDLRDADYIRMVFKKTSWYTFIAPVLAGAIAAGCDRRRQVKLRKFAALLGIAFQIRDDVLNLAGDVGKYGKEIGGDLWEGKHTLILMHALRTAPAPDRARAIEILGRSRPSGRGPSAAGDGRLELLLARLEASGDLSPKGRRELRGRLSGGGAIKSEPDVRFLARLIGRCKSIEYASDVATRYADLASRTLTSVEGLAPSIHLSFLDELVQFVVRRDR